MGPFVLIGKLNRTIGNIVDIVDKSVAHSGEIIDTAFEAIKIPSLNMLEDLKCDSIVDTAKRRVRVMHATAEAEEIERALSPKVVRASTKATKPVAK